MVIFTTGLCPFSCYYCPISNEKRGRDVVYADEMRVRRTSDLIDEAKAISATGAGITGGDPLAKAVRTARYSRVLKKEFGDDFHIHLYTMGTDKRKIMMVGKAGVDEIRFHPPPEAWRRMEKSAFPTAVLAARKSGMSVGLEVPLIPNRLGDLSKLLSWAQSSKLDFVNLNEMEFSETNRDALRARGYRVARGKAYGVAGSDKAARRLLSKKWSIPLHYCTSAYKDSWQLRQRIKRRANNVARPWDIITDDGTLIKGIVEGSNLVTVQRMMYRRFGVPRDLVWLDRQRNRIEVAAWILESVARDIDADSYIVEEYPTVDRLEVERRKLD